MSHIPGPWVVNPFNLESEDHAVFAAADRNSRKLICSVGMNPEYKANALLIAAAPELLEALEDFVSRAAKIVHVSPHWKFDFEKALAAIAKAKGENHA